MTIQDTTAQATDTDWGFYLADTALRLLTTPTDHTEGETHMMIVDPHTEGQIDVTGWDLDWLYEHISTVRVDTAQGNERDLTDDETEALSLTYRDTGLPGVTWTTGQRQVSEAVDYWGAIVDAAIYQRDLPSAIAAKSAGRVLTVPEQAAWDVYKTCTTPGELPA